MGCVTCLLVARQFAQKITACYPKDYVSLVV